MIAALGAGVARIEHRGWIVTAIQAFPFAFVVALSAVLLPGAGIAAVGIAWTGCQFILAVVLLATILRPVLLSGGGRGALLE